MSKKRREGKEIKGEENNSDNKNANDPEEEFEKLNFSDEDIAKLDLKSNKIKELMALYQERTDKYAIWRGSITEGFKKWLKGEKIYDRDKERISLYVSEDTKKKMARF